MSGSEQDLAPADRAERPPSQAEAEVLNISGDASSETGDIDFDGRACIEGSVRAGSSVKAGDAITIAGTVEPGALVHAQGDIKVGQGIIGKETNVVAKGTVRAEYV